MLRGLVIGPRGIRLGIAKRLRRPGWCVPRSAGEGRSRRVAVPDETTSFSGAQVYRVTGLVDQRLVAMAAGQARNDVAVVWEVVEPAGQRAMGRVLAALVRT